MLCMLVSRVTGVALMQLVCLAKLKLHVQQVLTNLSMENLLLPIAFKYLQVITQLRQHLQVSTATNAHQAFTALQELQALQ